VKLPGSAGGWLVALLVPVLAMALVWRVPAIKKIVIGE
jgi:hypothetical protein